MLAYVRDSELHVLNLSTNESKQLTHGAKKNGLIHGLAEYIAQEEMDRKSGYWWSLDSKYIAFTEVDFSEIPLLRIMHQGKSSVGSEAQEDHSYPFAGASNVKVRLGVVSVAGDSVTWMDLLCGGTEQQNNEEEYLARVNWMHGNILTTQVLNRHHTKIKILKFDIKTGQRKNILVEENSTWITLHDCFTPLDPVRLTQSKGKHIVVLDHHMQSFVDIHDSLDCPPRVLLCSLDDGRILTPLYEQSLPIPRVKRLQLEPPEIVEIQANDGTTLYGAIYKPD